MTEMCNLGPSAAASSERLRCSGLAECGGSAPLLRCGSTQAAPGVAQSIAFSAADSRLQK